MNSPCLNIVVEKYWKWNLERACCTPSPFPLTVDVNADYCLWFYLTVLVGLSKMVLTTYKSLTELKIRRLGLITFSQFSEVDTTRVLSLTNSSKFTLYSMCYSILYDVQREHEGTEGHWGRWPGYVDATKVIFSFRESVFWDVRTDYKLDLRFLVKKLI